MNNYCEFFQTKTISDGDRHEFLSFASAPSDPDVTQTIAVYLQNLLQRHLAFIEDAPDGIFSLEITLTINDDKHFKTDNIEKFYSAILELENASSFKIDCYCDVALDQNILAEDYAVKYNLKDYLTSIKDSEDFTYKIICFNSNTGEWDFSKITNSKSVSSSIIGGDILDIDEQLTTDIINVPVTEWFNWECSLSIDYDLTKYPKLLKPLRKIIKNYIPEDELEYCLEIWEDEPNIFINGIQWSVSNLESVKALIDEVNTALKPLGIDAYVTVSSAWVSNNEFAMAQLAYIDNEIKIIGTVL